MKDNLKVLVVGGGGREHSLIRKLKQSPLVDKLYAAPGNGGISCDAKCVDIKATDIQGITQFAVDNSLDFVVVAPDDPLVLGMVDALEHKGIKTFGPNKAAAIIEGSKIFSKDLMKKYNIPTAEYHVFDDYNSAKEYITNTKKFPVVIKADGLALGKGVIIAENKTAALSALEDIMVNKAFGDSGNKIVIEEFLQGTEVSILAFTDGVTIKPMISSIDHKRALDGDEGLNTGGMGTVAPHPLFTREIENICMETIFIPTIKAMEKENRKFKGCLFFGLMITDDGVKVIEYNCRFGDPEAQVVLPLLKTDLMEIFLAVYDEKLDEIEIEWHNKCAACVILASGGYPGKYKTGLPISGLENNGQVGGFEIYHAGTKKEDDKFYTAGGRVLGITAMGENINQTIQSAYNGIEKIKFDNLHYRKDIGKRII